jgi:DNA-binding response OmpR family regulator
MKILVAEDDPVASKLLRYTLEHVGHEPVLAADGLQAWDMFDRDPVRVIVSDWMMPGIDGLQFCRRVRERINTDYTYFILLTANHADRTNLASATEAGVDDFLTKPLDPQAIWMRLRVAERILAYTTQINQLNELLPICAYCKKIREDDAYWTQFETYITNHTGSNFSHGICPDCYNEQILLLHKEDAVRPKQLGARRPGDPIA